MSSYKRINILGVGVSAINMDIATAQIGLWIRQKKYHFVCIRDVHGIMKSQQDEELRCIHNRAGMVTPDGMPLVWLQKWKGNNEVSRVYGPDLMLSLCAAIPSYKHFFYGGSEGVADLLKKKLQACFPGLCVVGIYCPPFRPLSQEEDESIIQEINASNADIVWVGIGSPKQEKWMAAHQGKINAVMIGVGAAFDFLSGSKKQAPKWMQRNGLEWCFRLAIEPRRLWKRYLINNPLFIILVLLQNLGLKKYKL